MGSDESVPVELRSGQWHLPYIRFEELDNSGIFTEDLIKCSVARCARVSYNNHDNSNPSIQKDIELADKLLEAGHMRPFEHQATPMLYCQEDWEIYSVPEKGITDKDISGVLWSCNFRGWIQNRNLLDN